MRTITKCVLWLLALVAIAALLFPVFAARREKALERTCASNLNQISLGMMMYARDNDDHLPDAMRWPSQVYPYIRNDRVFICPAAPRDTGRTYAMNLRYSGARMHDFGNPFYLVIFYDADGYGRPVPRHHGGMNCSFINGYVYWMRGIPDGIDPPVNVAPPPKTGSRK